MKTHTITIHVTAPNSVSAEAVARHIHRMIWIGKEDAERALKNGEGDFVEAQEASSLHIKFGDQS